MRRRVSWTVLGFLGLVLACHPPALSATIATNEVQFKGPTEGTESHLRIPAETQMQFQLSTFVRVE